MLAQERGKARRNCAEKIKGIPPAFMGREVEAKLLASIHEVREPHQPWHPDIRAHARFSFP